MSHHVCVKLPDGRTAVADYRQPIVGVMYRVHKQAMRSEPGSPDDYALIAEWLDLCPEQGCSLGPIAAGAIAGRPDPTCGGKHPPALPEPVKLPRYQRPPGAPEILPPCPVADPVEPAEPVRAAAPVPYRVETVPSPAAALVRTGRAMAAELIQEALW
jgi:hypothetical protein